MYESMKVVQAVRDIVKESPDVIYQQDDGMCRYTKGLCSNGSCGCLIGQGIIKVYPELKEKLIQVDTQLVTIPAADSLFENYLEIPIDTAVCWLDYVQREQDNGKTWKEAVEYADFFCPIN